MGRALLAAAVVAAAVASAAGAAAGVTARGGLKGGGRMRPAAAAAAAKAGGVPAPAPATSGRNRRAGVPTGGDLPPHMGDVGLPRRVAGAAPGQTMNRPSLLPYNPVANASAVVTSPDGMARFTVLTPRLIRMEYAATAGVFEDASTIAMLNRNTPVPAFTSSSAGGVLTITTASVVLSYTLGSPFSASTLSVAPVGTGGSFPGWKYGDAAPGNLLGTIRGLDGQGNTPLNCTLNALILDNGEYNHCEWGLVSRDGWAIYDDSANYILDDMDWWVPTNPGPVNRTCTAGTTGTDVVSSTRSASFPSGTTAATASACCAACMGAADCVAWVWENDGSGNCWPLAGWAGTQSSATRTFGQVSTQPGSQQNGDALDLYGFFHGLDYAGALADFIQVGGRTIMAPKYASGVWWSRWYDLNNYDVLKVVDDYNSRGIPLDVFVIDMDWHTKDNWSGFTFDTHLFPYPADSMANLAALGLPVTLNIHDASGVNNWDAMFPELVAYLGMPANSVTVPFNLVNATVAYAVEDIVLGDLLYNKSVAFWWIDWQQGGTAGGMTGFKQNPTMWLNHLRCTDRHRVGDDTRAMVLARWGGLGGHRYQVGFSGDVAALTWGNLAYQPYFSATAANVGHGFWSHDIEGPATDMEMLTRWVQVGAFSGTMRTHDRGMSAGGCADDNPFDCSITEVWNTPNVNFPDAYMEASRLVLQHRAALLPVVYNGHRSAFDTGLGHIRPMYYGWPTLDAAYGMDANGNNVQYMFGPSILFSPVVTPGATNQEAMGPGLATKTTWLPPGTWVDAQSGVVTTVAGSDTAHMVTKAYALNEVPLWYVAGAVIPFVPLRMLPTTVGNAGRQYTVLGFTVVPGANNGSVTVYEDDGTTTGYLTAGASAWTTATYSTAGTTTTVTIATAGTYPTLPATRTYQIRLLNSGPIGSVTVNGVAVAYNRFGKAASMGRTPPASQYYWDYSTLPTGMGGVVDIVGASTASPITVTIVMSAAIPVTTMSGVYGAITHAIWAKANLDIERTTPGSNSVDPAYTSVLSSVGLGLEYLAGTSPANFAATIASVPALLANATAELGTLGSPRVSYSVGLLQNAMV